MDIGWTLSCLYSVTRRVKREERKILSALENKKNKKKKYLNDKNEREFSLMLSIRKMETAAASCLL